MVQKNFHKANIALNKLLHTVVRDLRVHELSQTDLVTLYQLHLLVWENYYIVYVHLISLRGILLYKIHYKICLSFRATCKGLLKHGIEKEEECSVNIKTYSAKSISYLVILQNKREKYLLPFQ